MTYQPFGGVETLMLGNGLIAANDRSLDGWLRGRRLTNANSASAQAGTKLSDIAYGYDAGGNMTSMEDKVTPARSSIYGYDAAGRVNMTVGPGSVTPQDYSYTAGTNKLASITASTAGGPSATRAIAYDARGNPTSETRNNGASGQSVAIAYDGHGRMTGYARQGEVSLSHSYNGNDDRISTTTIVSSGSAATATPDTRRFVYTPDGRVLGEYGASVSDVRAEFIWLSPQVGDGGAFGGDDGLGGYMPLAVAANDNGAPILAYVHANHMGVPAVYTGSNGAAINAPSGYSAPGFPGQSRTLADLYYNRYRDYDPTTGRYIQADPIGLSGGASPYSYAMNNPLMYTDPTGEIVPLVVIGGAIAWGLFNAGLDYGIQRFVQGKDANCIDWNSVAISGGIGALTGGIGGLGRISWKAAEFSHWIPARYVNPASKSYKPWLDKRPLRDFIDSPYNGNLVPPWFHGKTDWWRRPKGSTVADKWPLPVQQFVRIPSWVWAPVGAAGVGVAGADGDE